MCVFYRLVNTVFTHKFNYLLITVSLLFVCKLSIVVAYSGLATHDQNPLLIPYWIPHTLEANGRNGLQVSSSLFISNTLHDENNSNETLIIDAETYRFDLNFQYEVSDWLYHAQIPLISSSGGFLDGFIIKWHDTFGLAQGGRLQHPNEQLNIQYQRHNSQLINTQYSYDGIGDISLVIVRPLSFGLESAWNIGLGVNLPTGNNNKLISNDKIDRSVWLSYNPSSTPIFITLGAIQPGNGGVFKNTLKSSVFFSQVGFAIPINDRIKGQLQIDYHSAFIESNTDALGDSLQIQVGLHFSHLKSADIQLFFSEDIWVRSTPDITFGLQLDWKH